MVCQPTNPSQPDRNRQEIRRSQTPTASKVERHPGGSHNSALCG